MQKRILLACLLTSLFPILSSAAIRPVVSVALGSDRTNVFMTKNITMIPSFQNSYIASNHHDTEMVFGIFIGGEKVLPQNWALQMGVSYYQSSSFAANGNVYQFADPAFNNFTYTYQIQNRRFLIETKLSQVFRCIWHPYITVGLGESLNNAYAYTETPITSDAVSMAPPFNSHMTKSFTYLAGLGLDVDLGEHLRIGAAYRFLDLGNASLGVTPSQSSTNTISHTHLRTNEFLVQLSYIC